jgi:hypothetical protein
MTAHVLPDGGMLIGTPQACGWEGARHHWPEPIKRGFIAHASDRSMVPWLPGGKGLLIPMPNGRGPLAPGW